MIELKKKFESEPDWKPVTGEEYQHAQFFVTNLLYRSDIPYDSKILEDATMTFLKMRQIKSYDIEISILGIGV